MQSPSPVRLDAFCANVHSATGEDGVLRELFDRLGAASGYFCEFGAWDGMHFSNTYGLYAKGWGGCYIEADSRRFEALKKNVSGERAACVCCMVSAGPSLPGRPLDAILESVGAPQQFDLLSIDIDSDDLAVWRSLARHKPTVVVIEYNGTIPLGVRFANDFGGSHGNSVSSIHDFALANDYALVAQTTSNLIYLRDDYVAKAGVEVVEPWTEQAYFWGYDGTLLVQIRGVTRAPEVIRVPWARAFFMQPIPKFLRRFDRFGLAKRVLAYSIMLLTRPSLFVSAVVQSTRKIARSKLQTTGASRRS